MNPTEHQTREHVLDQIINFKAEGKYFELAEALESLASISIRETDLIAAANALEEAADIWLGLQEMDRFGTCLLLASTNRRLFGDLKGAKRVLELGLTFELSEKMKRSFLLEVQEQKLGNGLFEEAYHGFSNFISTLEKELAPQEQAKVYQRKATAANLTGRFAEAGSAFLKASELYNLEKQLDEAETCALAAVTVLLDGNPDLAEQIYVEVSKTTPTDGTAALKRSMLGSKISQKMGNMKMALKRMEEAIQAALDIVDPLSYVAGTVEAVHIAMELNQPLNAYGKLAKAWVSLADLIGLEEAGKLVKPEMLAFRTRIGIEKFKLVKQKYEQRQSKKKSKS